MRTDALFYQVFQALPDSYFELIGGPGRTAAGYTFRAEELKQASRRIDGVFVPVQPERPVHFVEVFFYKTAQAYANLFAKVFLWLETKNPAQEWHACLIFASRSLEPAEAGPYRALLTSDQVTRIYLDELPQAREEQFGLGLLELIVAPPEQALVQAKTWLGRVAQVKKSVAQRRQLVELIESILLGHFPTLGRKELEAMIQIKDLRETRVYQEALQEGLEQGLEQGLKQGQEQGLKQGQEQGLKQGQEQGLDRGREEIALRLLAEQFSVAKVAEITGLPQQRVRRLKRQQTGNR